MQLTEVQRAALLDRAVEAVRARYAVGPDTDPGEVTRLAELARLAVTDAVTRGDHIHTLISHRAGVSGLLVIDLIADWPAQGKALAVERHAAARYAEQVRQRTMTHARQRVGAQGHGAKAEMARQFGVTRKSVDAWIDHPGKE
ncbi:hypothetical protein ABT336_11810 [Micromonospora sp. NPDC000207]|uniref:hypothetical protein n=1 Tax=Micromonospora sp. NPDC000207 TaxID=3154246 RepID=UPI003316FF6E